MRTLKRRLGFCRGVALHGQEVLITKQRTNTSRSCSAPCDDFSANTWLHGNRKLDHSLPSQYLRTVVHDRSILVTGPAPVRQAVVGHGPTAAIPIG
jgi:hypothetical protein